MVTLLLTPDEAAALYHSHTNGLQTGNSKVRQSLILKIEKAYADGRALRIRALKPIFTEYKDVTDGKEASVA